MADEESLEMRDKAGSVGKSSNSLSIDLSTRRRHQSSGSVGKWLVPATNAWTFSPHAKFQVLRSLSFSS